MSILDMNYGYQPQQADPLGLTPQINGGYTPTAGFQMPGSVMGWNGPSILQEGLGPSTLGSEPSLMDNIFGSTGKPGWLGTAVGAAQGIGQIYMGMKQYGLAKETLANNKEQFAKNYAAQKQTTNTALEDRQRARVASNPGAYESVGAYMANNGVR